MGLAQVGGTGNDRDGWVEAAGFQDEIPRSGTGRSENQDPRLSETGVLI